jgi:short-subunit dehydrogenase
VSLSAAVATRPTPYFAAYAASKASVTNLSEAMDKELHGFGICVSAIHPSLMPLVWMTVL